MIVIRDFTTGTTGTDYTDYTDYTGKTLDSAARTHYGKAASAKLGQRVGDGLYQVQVVTSTKTPGEMRVEANWLVSNIDWDAETAAREAADEAEFAAQR